MVLSFFFKYRFLCQLKWKVHSFPYKKCMPFSHRAFVCTCLCVCLSLLVCVCVLLHYYFFCSSVVLKMHVRQKHKKRQEISKVPRFFFFFFCVLQKVQQSLPPHLPTLFVAGKQMEFKYSQAKNITNQKETVPVEITEEIPKIEDLLQIPFYYRGHIYLRSVEDKCLKNCRYPHT